MRFIITGRNIDITEGLKSAVEEKLGKLDRFFAPETDKIVDKQQNAAAFAQEFVEKDYDDDEV